MQAIDWKKGSRAELVLDKIASISKVLETGAVSYDGESYLTLMPVLHNLIVYKTEYSFQTKVMFREKAVSICLKSGSITKLGFIKELRRQASIFDQKKLERFYLTTSLSIRHGELPKVLKLPNSEAYLYSGPLPKKYECRKAHDAHWEAMFPNQSPLPQSYTGVVIAVNAKTGSDAFDIAMKDLNLFRGLLNLNFNSDESMTFGHANVKPLNKVMLGGMHCIHKKNGDLIENNSFWYEAHFAERSPLSCTGELSHHPEKIRKYIKLRLELISRYPDSDKEKLFSAVARYALALDEFDYSASVHKLWAAMESLLISSGQKSDVMIKRCSYTCIEPDFHAQVLMYLKDYRNSHIHQGVNDGEAERHCYSLQRYFRHMIAFYFGFSSFFNDLNEANNFLDNSNDITILNRQIELLQRAKKYVQVI
tara:strand:- start:4043 stop:5308 length:1266 start_codon:yes stop_codon:yes gene_type:complete